MEQCVARKCSKRADDYGGSLIACDLEHTGGFQLAFVQQLGVLMRSHQSQTGEERNDVDGECNIERVAPAPIEEVIRRKAGIEKRKERARNDETHWRAELSQHGVPTAAVLGGIECQQRR